MCKEEIVTNFKRFCRRENQGPSLTHPGAGIRTKFWKGHYKKKNDRTMSTTKTDEKH